MREHAQPNRAGPIGRRADELELMERVRADDVSALDALMSLYWRPLIVYALEIVGSMDAAEDVVQDVFVQVWSRRSDWRPRGSARSFLYRIARNRALNERRARRVRELWAARAGEPDAAAAATPLRLLETREVGEQVRRAIAALPARQREIVTLARFHGLSHAQIAEVLGISQHTVANHIRAAFAALRDALRPLLDGDTPSD